MKHLKNITERTLLGDIAGCVITVPAYFDDAQRQATKDAAKLCWLNVLRLLNEPTAAAIAYGLNNKDASKVMVYDLGGGTFDVSILNLDDGVFKVLATGGNSSLGGDDFDNILTEYIEKELNINLDLEKKHQLYLYAKDIKTMLSHNSEVKINLKKFGLDDKEILLTREKFNMLIDTLVKETLKISKEVLFDSGLNINELDEIILVGGSTRIPYIKFMVENFLIKNLYQI